MSKKTKRLMIDKIHFVVNETEKTASVIGHESIRNVCIPRSIKHENQEFIITSILKGAFEDSTKIVSVQFPSDSEIRVIEKYAFSHTSIRRITIPPHVTRISEFCFYSCKKLKKVEFAAGSELQTIEKDAFCDSSIECLSIPSNLSELQEGWCNGTPKLTSVTIMPNNKHFLNLNDKMVIGKTDQKSDKYDILVFVRRDVKEISIPSFITQIGPSSFASSSIESILVPQQVTEIGGRAFQSCKSLQKVEFSENSELRVIHDHAFVKTSIENIIIPPSVVKICTLAFSACDKLVSVDISANSKLEVIEKNVFNNSAIESLTVPSSVTELQAGWCDATHNLNKITITPCKLENIKYYNDQLIIGKTDLKDDVFDVVLFARRDSKAVCIPPFIKRIGPYAFDNADIERILIPPQVECICQNAFCFCQKLQAVEIPSNSQLQTIGSFAFAFSQIKSICIPPHVMQIGASVFHGCADLLVIEIEENSEDISKLRQIISNQDLMLYHDFFIMISK